MSGCYQCGHVTGSDESLCEYCYQRRFHQVPKEQQVVDAPAEGIELSERARGLALTSGALLYVAVILVVAISAPYIEDYRKRVFASSSTDPRYDFVVAEEESVSAFNRGEAVSAVRASHVSVESPRGSPVL